MNQTIIEVKHLHVHSAVLNTLDLAVRDIIKIGPKLQHKKKKVEFHGLLQIPHLVQAECHVVQVLLAEAVLALEVLVAAEVSAEEVVVEAVAAVEEEDKI